MADRKPLEGEIEIDGQMIPIEFIARVAEHTVAVWRDAPKRADEFVAEFGGTDEFRENMIERSRAINGGREGYEAACSYLRSIDRDLETARWLQEE